MATEHLDLVRDLSASEQGGALMELRRLALVSGLATNSIEALFTALNTLSLTVGSTLTLHPNVVLTQRNPRMIDKGAAEVELVYQHFGRNEFQNLADPPNGELVFTCDAALTDKTTQVDAAEDGDPIVLGYIYAATDPHYKSNTLAERTRTQGGEVSVRIPTRTLRLAGTLAHPDPDLIVAGILGMVNDKEWKSGAARTWICSQASYESWDYDTDTYKYTFLFEYNSDGWDQKAVFVHESTGRIVPDWLTATDGAGHAAFKLVGWYSETDFENYFLALSVVTE